MELLIILGANIQILPDIPNIANHHGLHAFSMERGNKSRCLLMLNILDLVFEFPELFLLGTNEFLASTGAFLLPVDLL